MFKIGQTADDEMEETHGARTISTLQGLLECKMVVAGGWKGYLGEKVRFG